MEPVALERGELLPWNWEEGEGIRVRYSMLKFSVLIVKWFSLAMKANPSIG